MTNRGRPKNPENSVKKRILQVRLKSDEKEAFEEAAKLSGLPVASWVRERLRDVSRKELEAAGKKVKFLS